MMDHAAAPMTLDSFSAGSDLLEEARRIFALQQANRWQVARSTAEERAAKLERLGTSIVAHRDDLYQALWDDFHKHQAEVELTEIQSTLIELESARTNLARWMRPVRARTPWLLAGTRGELRYEPRGVVLIMAPWNYPVGLLLNPLIAAVAAGNCVIVRPSEKVPRTAAVLTRLIRQAFDEAEVACLTEVGIELANALITMPFDHIFFTGSIPVGRKVMAAAAGNLASVTLELGGKSPLVVDETAHLRTTAERAVWGKFINAGQTCVAPDYALVHEHVLPAFVEAAKQVIAAFYGETEAARQASPDYPRVIDDAAFQRLSRLLDETVAAGAQVAIGGRTDPAERYLAPTILTDVSWDAPLMREEIFGPILPVLPFRSLEEVPARINALGKPLALYMFSRRAEHIETVLSQTSSGGAVVNNVVIHLANHNLPFGGVGASGQGSYHGWYGFRTFSHERSVLRQGRATLVNLFFPPYGRTTERILDVVGRLLT